MKTNYFKCVLLFTLLFAGQWLYGQQCITIDACALDGCNKTVITSLDSMKQLKKGEFFTVKIKGINPYRYNVKIIAKDDTFKTGNEPPLFSNFMDVAKFGELAGTLLNFTPSVIIKTDSMVNMSEKITFGFEKILGKPAEKEPEDFVRWDLDSAKYVIDYRALNAYAKVKKWKPEQKNEFILDIKEAIRLETAKVRKRKEVADLLKEMQEAYKGIKSCYDSSVINILNAQYDCNGNNQCYSKKDCDCLKNDGEKINLLLGKKQEVEKLLDNPAIAETIGEDLKKKIEKELGNTKYERNYLTEVYFKAYSNFKTASSIDLLSNYNSLPIQVKGDRMELKIDITPKDQPDPKKKDKDDKEKTDEDPKADADDEPKKEKKNSTHTLTNQSPVTININAPQKDGEEPGKKKDETDPDKKEGKDKEDEDPSETASSGITDTTFRIKLPPATLERHLSYSFRTGQTFYGFGGGFFVDWLHDYEYVSRPVDPNDPATQFKLVREGNESPNKYGIMASVNCGRYVKQSNFFGQIFIGPGLSMETKVQPRLLAGLGIGWGEQNKFSLNGGVALGQVKRLSNAFDTSVSYAVEQTNMYHTTLAARGFVALIYTFDGPKK